MIGTALLMAIVLVAANAWTRYTARRNLERYHRRKREEEKNWKHPFPPDWDGN